MSMLFSFLIKIFKNINLISVSLLVLFFTAACGQPDKEIYRDSWKDDVLVAQECGLSGLSCCFDQENKCESGLDCCIDPSNEKNGYCGESCNFGNVDKFCRKDEPRCDSPAVCVNDYCLECGVTGNPCCEGGKCLGQNNINDSRAECINGICTLCGSSGEVSCPNDFKCMDGNLDNGGFCHKCGDLNQPCCADEKICNKNLKCQLGFCS